MNRFERLFFILERNGENTVLGNRDVRGVVKIVLTAEQIRIMWEMNGLPVRTDAQYEIGIFLQKKDSQQLRPTYFPFQPNPYGNARIETVMQYKLQEGETVSGVALSVLEKNGGGNRFFPLIAFQNMQGPWKTMLQSLETQPKPQPQPQPKPQIHSREEVLRKQFVTYDPFGTTNMAYRWWRSTDMHLLNQVLAEFNLSLPLELNKDGYLACGLFGHVLLGLYTDSTLKREFFILGIPAKTKRDNGNYYSHSRWEAVGNQVVPEQEETGYWLTYIDCDTSKVVKVV